MEDYWEYFTTTAVANQLPGWTTHRLSSYDSEQWPSLLGLTPSDIKLGNRGKYSEPNSFIYAQELFSYRQ